jgi:hypothetical protein
MSRCSPVSVAGGQPPNLTAPWPFLQTVLVQFSRQKITLLQLDSGVRTSSSRTARWQIGIVATPPSRRSVESQATGGLFVALLKSLLCNLFVDD